MRTLSLQEIKIELNALDDWLADCREKIAEVTQQLRLIPYLDAPHQSVIQSPFTETSIDGWRKTDRRDQGVDTLTTYPDCAALNDAKWLAIPVSDKLLP